MSGLKIAAALAAFCIMAGSVASATTVSNGGFENGFTGFTTLGDTSIVDGTFGVAPTEGNNQALLGTTGVSDADIETALGVAAGSLDAFSAGFANGGTVTNGSVITRVINTVVGRTLTFDFTFLTSESTPAGFNDGAFFFADGQFFSLGDTGSSGFASSPTTFNEQLATSTFTHTFTTGGPQIIGFGVFNEGDTAVASGLIIDNVSPAPVPVPAALPLLLTAFGGLVALKRRRQKA